MIELSKKGRAAEKPFLVCPRESKQGSKEESKREKGLNGPERLS